MVSRDESDCEHARDETAVGWCWGARSSPCSVSLGGTESLAEHPGTMTHSDIEPEEKARMGITPSMVRLSIGIEHPEDVIQDLRLALEKV